MNCVSKQNRNNEKEMKEMIDQSGAGIDLILKRDLEELKIVEFLR